MLEYEERESEVLVVRVCVLLSEFSWVDIGLFLAHTDCQIELISLAKQNKAKTKQKMHAPHIPS